MKKTVLMAVSALLSGLFFCCTGQVRDDGITDFTNAGFVTDSCFQVIVRAQPDPSSRSLTEKRESSLKLAREQLLHEARTQLKSYILSSKFANQEAIMPEIEKEVENYISKGYTVCNYNLEDASSVIVYRVYAKGLKKEIDDLVLELKGTDGPGK